MIRHLFNALFRPARTNSPYSLLRRIAQAPRVFDLISLILQSQDLGRLNKLSSTFAETGEYHRKVLEYNAGVTTSKRITTTRRAEEYYDILTLPPRDLSNERLLIVGPRNIQELFAAWTRGFSWSNICGIDLYSTNSKITVMNMEAMTFADESFDAVSMANTLSYAEDTFTALKEVARILKVGGRYAFSATYDPNEKWHQDAVTGAQIKEMLDRLNLMTYFYVAREFINSEGRLQTSHSFGVRKTDPEATLRLHDPLIL